MLNVYVLRNNLTQTYAPYEFRAEDPKTWFKRIHDSLILFSENAVKNFLHVSTILHVGTYDEETGFITPCEGGFGLQYNIQADFEQLMALKNIVKGDEKDA